MKRRPRYTIRQRNGIFYRPIKSNEPVYLCFDNSNMSIVFTNFTWSEVLRWVNR